MTNGNPIILESTAVVVLVVVLATNETEAMSRKKTRTVYEELLIRPSTNWTCKIVFKKGDHYYYFNEKWLEKLMNIFFLFIFVIRGS